MKDRIAHIMRAKNLKATDFAELLGIQPSGISHILSGRNQPSLDFVKKIKETFPEYNLDWIIFGKGPMTTSEPFKENFNSSNSNPAPSIQPPVPSDPNAGDLVSEPVPFLPIADPESSKILPDVSPSSPIKTLFVLYEDGTFETYSPK